MTRLFVGPSWPDGTHYELSLPDDWISKDDGDGERKFISHRSPQGARLVLWLFRQVGPEHIHYDLDRDRAINPLKHAYSHAKSYANNRRAGDSFLMWLLCVLLGGVGLRPTLVLENLGICSGYTFRIKSGKNAGWYGDFAVDTWWIRMAFWISSEDSEGEIDLARTVVSSLRFVKP